MDVRREIRGQLDDMFEAAPQTRASWELQEELFANCMERYKDLISAGMQENDAINSVMSSIGNVDELVEALPGEEQMNGRNRMYGGNTMSGDDRYSEAQQKSAIATAISVGLYILAVAVFFTGMFIGGYVFPEAMLIGVILAIVICIVPTCMLVYNAKRYPKYTKKSDTVVEEFKEWSNDSKKAKSLRSAVSSLLWTCTVVVYLAVSFATSAWHITWIIFLICACIETAINLLFKMRENR